ncbi:hypothetical protein L2E82_28155 [Cichorium intybus]|uniref:Uncharacterized protein n=1 Tax=Cichorium intybus TaxID=13427 RepID=A0ACB9CV65_CICIN|nr:hypothetical protein L2E82_28155 [Cichorium intybus]
MKSNNALKPRGNSLNMEINPPADCRPLQRAPPHAVHENKKTIEHFCTWDTRIKTSRAEECGGLVFCKSAVRRRNVTLDLEKHIQSPIQSAMEVDGGGGSVSVSVAIVACTAMTIFYVAILYSPTLILRLPPPTSFKSYMIRRFVCAGISTVVSLLVCACILHIKSWETSDLLSAYGIHLHHTWEAVLFPLSLTSLMYTGSFLLKFLSLWTSLTEQDGQRINLSFHALKTLLQSLIIWIQSLVYNIASWRLYIVAPLTEELVFRACMIPLLLCGGFKPYTVILLSPVFFSLAHLNHLLEFYMQQQDSSLLKAAMVVGFQLGYTVIFGSYASFLFVRTGHIAAPLVSHMFCNFMGLPAFFSRRNGMVSVGFVAGAIGFVYFLFPLTSPELYNDTTHNCKCWHRYCDWS